jgi:hypothetical protein
MGSLFDGLPSFLFEPSPADSFSLLCSSDMTGNGIVCKYASSGRKIYT